MRLHRITTAAHRIVSKRQVAHAERRRDGHPLKCLTDVKWAQAAKWTWAKVVKADGEEIFKGYLMRLVEFVGSEKVDVRVDVTGNIRKAWQHRIAGDLGLATWSGGVEGQRGVLVGRRGYVQALDA